jgi:transcriptional regulator with XRE-family HTH domain
MKDLIKKIRTHMNMNQTEFAEQLNVTFATVNRWENGRALPNKLAQDKIYDLCKEYDVPVYNMVLEKIEVASRSLELEKGRVLLYHGSKSGIEGVIEPKSRKQCDFGAGFYMGTEPSQVLTLICDYERARFYIVSVEMEELNVLAVPADLEWAMLVAYHRGRMETIKGAKFYNKYKAMTEENDLVIGSIANDRMFHVIDSFFQGNLTDAALVNSLSALELGKQYVAVTKKGCDAVRIEKEISISYLEKMFLKEVSEANRVKGVSMADDICKNYRREGLFFDEILEQEAGKV